MVFIFYLFRCDCCELDLIFVNIRGINFILQKMKTLILIVFHIAAVFCQFSLNKLSYTKLPYTTDNRFGLLRNAAHQAAYHAQERLLYVLGKCLLDMFYLSYQALHTRCTTTKYRTSHPVAYEKGKNNIPLNLSYRKLIIHFIAVKQLD